MAALLASGVSSSAQWDVPTVFLKGQVLIEDGRPVPEAIQVELVCEGKVVEQTYPDPQGYFGFELGTRKAQSDWMDSSVGDAAGVAGRVSTPSKFGQIQGTAFFGVNLMSCEIRVPPQPGYVSSPIQLSRRSVFDDTDVGTIILRQPGHVGGTVVSVSTAAAPDDARVAFEKAREELGKEQVEYSRVTKELETAVRLYPEFAAAWHLLGQTRLLLADRNGAREAFRQAIRTDDRFILPYVDLARMEFQEKNWNAVSELTDQLSELSPELPEAYYYGGLARYSSGQIEEAEKSLRWLDERGLCGRYPLTYFYLGVIDSKRGEIELAATELRLFLKSTPEAQVPPDWRKKITEQLAQWQEQGLIEGE